MTLCVKVLDNEGVQLSILCNTAALCAVMLRITIAKPFPAAHTLSWHCQFFLILWQIYRMQVF